MLWLINVWCKYTQINVRHARIHADSECNVSQVWVFLLKDKSHIHHTYTVTHL